jgi:phage head maturation protease
MTEIIQLPQFMRDAEVRAGSFNEGANTVDVIWTAGATVRRRSWVDGEFDEELIVSPNAVRLDRLNAGAPFLDTHDTYSLRSVIGSVVPGSARIEAGRGVASILLTRRADAQGTVQDIRDGVIRNISAGYKIYGVEKQERKGQVTLMRVTDWEPMEISAVPVQADPGARVRSGDPKPETFACSVTRALADANEVRRIRLGMQQRMAGLAR